MPTYSYCFTEYDAKQPWVIVSTGRDSVELPEGVDFYEWATGHYPPARFRIELERERFRWMT